MSNANLFRANNYQADRLLSLCMPKTAQQPQVPVLRVSIGQIVRAAAEQAQSAAVR